MYTVYISKYMDFYISTYIVSSVSMNNVYSFISLYEKGCILQSDDYILQTETVHKNGYEIGELTSN